jgi:hypothetical protein
MRGYETVVFVLGVSSVAGCSGCSRSASDSPGSAADARATAVSPWASNWADITRFQDEVPFGPDAVVNRDHTVARAAPDEGNVIATLPSGAYVVKLARHKDQDLVTFDGPTGGGERLMGWVPESALDEPNPSPASPSPASPPPPLPADSADGATPPVPPSPPEPSPAPGPAPRKHHHRPHTPP